MSGSGYTYARVPPSRGAAHAHDQASFVGWDAARGGALLCSAWALTNLALTIARLTVVSNVVSAALMLV